MHWFRLHHVRRTDSSYITFVDPVQITSRSSKELLLSLRLGHIYRVSESPTKGVRRTGKYFVKMRNARAARSSNFLRPGILGSYGGDGITDSSCVIERADSATTRKNLMILRVPSGMLIMSSGKNMREISSSRRKNMRVEVSSSGNSMLSSLARSCLKPAAATVLRSALWQEVPKRWWVWCPQILPVSNRGREN